MAGTPDPIDALAPFADVAQAVSETEAAWAAKEKSWAAEHQEPPGQPIHYPDNLRAEVRFYAYGGPEVGDVEYDELRYVDLTLADFRTAQTIFKTARAAA